MEVFQVLGNSLWACLLQASTTLHGTLPYSVRERLLSALGIVTYVSLIPSAPPSFPSSGNGLWYTAPGTIWVQEFLPIGNGYLGGE
jgi:alpha-L-fucosidase 2